MTIDPAYSIDVDENGVALLTIENPPANGHSIAVRPAYPALGRHQLPLGREEELGEPRLRKPDIHRALELRVAIFRNARSSASEG
jgi:hypothetical protein